METQHAVDAATAGRNTGRGIVPTIGIAFGGSVMDSSLLQLMEELLQSIEQRDAGDPDAPAWEATIRIQRLEEELSRRIARTGAGRPGSRGSGSVASDAHNELLVGSA